MIEYVVTAPAPTDTWASVTLMLTYAQVVTADGSVTTLPYDTALELLAHMRRIGTVTLVPAYERR